MEIEIKHSEFADRYKPIDEYFEDHQDALALAGGDMYRVWTVRDDEGRYTSVTNGIGWVNRLEYIVTEVPWTHGESIYVGHD